MCLFGSMFVHDVGSTISVVCISASLDKGALVRIRGHKVKAGMLTRPVRHEAEARCYEA